MREKSTPDGFVYVTIKQGIYRLPQSGILAKKLLEKRLNAHGYQQRRFTPSLWNHEWRPICFTHIVDYFRVKYVGKEHAYHLINCIKENNEITEDWEGKCYLGLTFDWNDDTHSIHLYMQNYIPDTLKHFKRKNPNKWQGTSHQHTVPNYGVKQQFSKEEYIQQVIGAFLYYVHAVDLTMPVALSAISSKHEYPTKSTMEKVDQFLDYTVSQEQAVLIS